MALLSTYPIIHLDKERKTNGMDASIKGFDKEYSQEFRPILQSYTESMALKGLGQATRSIYLKGFKRFLSHHTGSDINTLRYRELLRYVKAQAVAMHPTKLKQTIFALKFYYEHTQGRDKMFFPLAKNRKASLSTLYLPFYDLKELTDGIESPGDKLLLFLVYHANLKLSDICRLPNEAKSIFEHQFRMPGNNERALQYFQELVAECNKHYRQNTYLFEYNGHAHNASTLKTKLFRILGHYRMEDIYRKQYQQILKHTNFSVRTRAMYLNAFMKFLKHFKYKHPAFITDNEIRAYRALHRNKSIAHQNILVSSFKFFFDKVHNRYVSRQIFERPRKDLHVSAYCSHSKHAAMQDTASIAGLRYLQNCQIITSLKTTGNSSHLKCDDLLIKASSLRHKVAFSGYTAYKSHSPP